MGLLNYYNTKFDFFEKCGQKWRATQSPSCPKLSPQHSHCRQKRGGLLEVSSRISRACFRRTVGALLVLWSCKAGAHTFPGSIPQASVPVPVHIHGRLCLFLVLFIRACIFLWPAVHILDRAVVLPPSHSQSSDVFCVAFCA